MTKRLVIPYTNINSIVEKSYHKQKPQIEHTPFGDARPIYTHKLLKPSTTSTFGTEAYRTSLSRAFNRAKLQIFFNPDMTKLVTLTYRHNMTDIVKLQEHLKYLIKKQNRLNKANNFEIDAKWLYVVEKQKRGSLHVHMICNEFLTLQKNKNGYDEVANWSNGFSSVLDIRGADASFKPYLYLFKYMSKSQRIGKSFVNASRNLNNHMTIEGEINDKQNYQIYHKSRSLDPMLRVIVANFYKIKHNDNTN